MLRLRGREVAVPDLLAFKCKHSVFEGRLAAMFEVSSSYAIRDETLIDLCSTALRALAPNVGLYDEHSLAGRGAGKLQERFYFVLVPLTHLSRRLIQSRPWSVSVLPSSLF